MLLFEQSLGLGGLLKVPGRRIMRGSPNNRVYVRMFWVLLTEIAPIGPSLSIFSSARYMPMITRDTPLVALVNHANIRAMWIPEESWVPSELSPFSSNLQSLQAYSTPPVSPYVHQCPSLRYFHLYSCPQFYPDGTRTQQTRITIGWTLNAWV